MFCRLWLTILKGVQVQKINDNNRYFVHDNERRVKRLVSNNKTNIDNLYIIKSSGSKAVDRVMNDDIISQTMIIYTGT